MKRKRTELEEKLIKNGWELDHKNYTGKHSDKILSYVYEKCYEKAETQLGYTDFTARIELDQKRTQVIDIFVRQKTPEFVDIFQICYLDEQIRVVERELESYKNKSNELTDEEIVESVELVEKDA